MISRAFKSVLFGEVCFVKPENDFVYMLVVGRQRRSDIYVVPLRWENLKIWLVFGMIELRGGTMEPNLYIQNFTKACLVPKFQKVLKFWMHLNKTLD